jgi:hypothetical protein
MTHRRKRYMSVTKGSRYACGVIANYVSRRIYRVCSIWRTKFGAGIEIITKSRLQDHPALVREGLTALFLC